MRIPVRHIIQRHSPKMANPLRVLRRDRAVESMLPSRVVSYLMRSDGRARPATEDYGSWSGAESGFLPRRKMTTEQRRKFIRWFCILGPTLCGLVTVLLMVSLESRLNTLIPRPLQGIAAISPLFGWAALTLACSAMTAGDICKRLEHRDGTRLIALVLMIPIIALAHTCCASVIAFAGCMVLVGPLR